MIEQEMLYFSGALNLDIIFEIDDLSPVAAFLKKEIRPGHEYIVTHGELSGLREVLSTSGRERYRGGGGSAANTCVALSALGFNTAFIGACGLDEAGDIVLKEMGDVDLKIVKRANKTATCIILLTKRDKDRAILVAPGTDAFPLLDAVDVASNITFLHLSSLPTQKGLEFHMGLVESITDSAILSLDPGEIYSRLGVDTLSHLLKRTDILLLTEGEYEMLFGRVEPKEIFNLLNKEARKRAFKRAWRLKPPLIVIKKGRDGAELHGIEDVRVALDARKVEHIVDNTGAGDAFDAGFIKAWLRGEAPHECLDEGNRLAALSLGDWGRRWLRRLENPYERE